MKEEEKVCENCGGTEGEIIEYGDSYRHSRMESCIKYLSEQFRAKRQARKSK